MKKNFLFYALLLIAGFAFGQAQEGIVEYNKTSQPAAMIALPYSTDVVNAAMDDYLLKKASKSYDLKGFKTFRNTQLVQGDSTNADLYFKIVRKSRKEKNESMVYLMVGMPNEAIATRTGETHFSKDQAKEYLNTLASVIEAYNLELQIQEQNDAVMKEEKKYRSLQDEGNELSKRKMDIEQKITNNIQYQEKQHAEVERQKQALAQLVNQRKS